jgi:hypothetical protein
MLIFLVAGMFPWPARWRGGSCDSDPATEPWWRAALWLGAWIIIPAYAFFYCRSFEDPASPIDWLSTAGGWWGAQWPWLVATTLIVLVAATIWRRLATILLVVAASAFLVFAFGRNRDWTTWTPFAFNLIRWTMLIAAPSLVWAFAGETLAQRFIKLGQLLIVVGVLFLVCFAAHGIWEHVRLEALAKNPGLEWHTIWHTRYLGVIWPAVWIAAAGLIVRLPTRPVRWTAVGLIVAANLTNGIARSVAQTQVPYDQVFADAWLSQPGAPVRMYFDLNGGMAGFFSAGGVPAGNYWRPMASYNAAVAGRMQTNPEDFRSGKTWPFEYGPMIERFEKAIVYRPYVAAGDVAADVSKSPELKRVIIWQRTGSAEPSSDRLLAMLGGKWRLVHENVVHQYWYWTWRPQEYFRRREFVRIGA